MLNIKRIPQALIYGLVILAFTSLSCKFLSNLVPFANQPDEQNQQNEQQNPNLDQPPNMNPDPDQDLGGVPDGGAFEITGIWDSQVDTSQGTVTTRLILEHTGTFSQTVTWNGLMTLDTGEYNIIGNAVHFTVTHHEPTEFQGQPMSWVTSFTYFVTPIDATTMTVEDHIMNTSWTMYRTGP